MGFIPFTVELIAQADTETLAKYGLLGVVLAWFMWRADKRLGNIEHKITGLNRTLLIEMLGRIHLTENARKLALRELQRTDPDAANEISGE